jgi:hypothetical protein
MNVAQRCTAEAVVRAYLRAAGTPASMQVNDS